MNHNLVIAYDRIGEDPIEFVIQTILEAGGSELKRPTDTTIEFKLWESSPENYKMILETLNKMLKPYAKFVIYEQVILVDNRDGSLQTKFDELIIKIIKTKKLVYFH